MPSRVGHEITPPKPGEPISPTMRNKNWYCVNCGKKKTGKRCTNKDCGCMTFWDGKNPLISFHSY